MKNRSRIRKVALHRVSRVFLVWQFNDEATVEALLFFHAAHEAAAESTPSLQNGFEIRKGSGEITVNGDIAKLGKRREMRWMVVLLSCCLLASDAAPLVVLYLPIGGGVTRLVRGVRIIRGIRGVLRVGSLIRKLSIARRILRLAPLLLLHRREKGLLTRGDEKCPGKPLRCDSKDMPVNRNPDKGVEITISL